MEFNSGDLPKHQSATVSAREPRLFIGLAFGAMGTVMVYWLIPFSPIARDLLTRYFCSHPLAYISTGMCCCALSVLFFRWKMVRSESRAIADLQTAFDEHRANHVGTNDDQATMNWLTLWVTSGVTSRTRGSQVHRRLCNLVDYLQVSGSEQLESYVRYLGDQAAERMHQGYATIRTITWAIPILGFLGTVIGITLAIANVTPEQLETSLGEVTGGLAVAFDTTALALSLSIGLVFTSFFVERSEQAVLNEIEDLSVHQILPVMHRSQGKSSVRTSHETTLSEAMLKDLMSAWGDQLTRLRDDWATALGRQAEQMSRGLENEVTRTLSLFGDTVRQQSESHAARLQSTEQHVESQLTAALADHTKKLELWQAAQQTGSLHAAAQLEAIHEVGQTLADLADTEKRLLAMQKSIEAGLESARLVESLEQTTSSLTAAIHLLTARVSQRAA